MVSQPTGDLTQDFEAWTTRRGNRELRCKIRLATFDKYKSKHGGMAHSDAKRLRVLGDKNGKLDNPVAEQMRNQPVMATSAPYANNNYNAPDLRTATAGVGQGFDVDIENVTRITSRTTPSDGIRDWLHQPGLKVC